MRWAEEHNSHILCVSGTGGGKTTLLHQYMVQGYHQRSDIIWVYFNPKNDLILNKSNRQVDTEDAVEVSSPQSLRRALSRDQHLVNYYPRVSLDERNEAFNDLVDFLFTEVQREYPVVLICDEAWSYVDADNFSWALREGKTGYNTKVVAATQSDEDISRQLESQTDWHLWIGPPKKNSKGMLQYISDYDDDMMQELYSAERFEVTVIDTTNYRIDHKQSGVMAREEFIPSNT